MQLALEWLEEELSEARPVKLLGSSWGGSAGLSLRFDLEIDLVRVKTGQISWLVIVRCVYIGQPTYELGRRRLQRSYKHSVPLAWQTVQGVSPLHFILRRLQAVLIE